MIKHIVFFKLEEKELSNKIKNMLLDLKDKIDELKYIEVGLNFNKSDRAFDIALVTHFESKEDLKAYQIHPEHQKVVEFLKSQNVISKVVDYEF